MELKCPFCGKDDIESRLALCVQCGASIRYNVKKWADHEKRSDELVQSTGNRLNLVLFAPVMFFLAFDAYLILETGDFLISSIIAAVPALVFALVLYLFMHRLNKWIYRDIEKHTDALGNDDDVTVESRDIATFSRDGREIDVEVPTTSP